MAVGIDEARCQHQPIGIDDVVRVTCRQIAQRCNAITAETHATQHRGRSRAIDNAGVGNQRIGECP